MNDTLQQFLTLSSKFRIHDAGDSLKILKEVQPAGLDFRREANHIWSGRPLHGDRLLILHPLLVARLAAKSFPAERTYRCRWLLPFAHVVIGGWHFIKAPLELQCAIH